MTRYTCARAVIGTELISNPVLTVEDGLILEVVVAAPGAVGATENPTDLGDVTLVPGFVDMHVHGGGSYSFSDGTEAASTAADFHRRHGTTSLLASLATASLNDLSAQAQALRPLVADGTLAGIHLEGPFLNEARRGAHNPSLLRNPEINWLREHLSAEVKMVTLAPELPGGLDAVRFIVESGAIAALGHSDATYEQARVAIDAGVRVATHLFNGMRPVHHREPAAVVALIRDPRVTVELICDGVHVHPALIAGVFDSVGPHRVALVTDAISATGMSDGVHELAGSQIRVTDGVAELIDGSSLAGSTLTMDMALRNTVASGVNLVDAVRASSTNGAQRLGLIDRGEIANGKRADLVALDSELQVVGVMQRGTWIVDSTQTETPP